MLNREIKVPDNTIAIFHDPFEGQELAPERIKNIIKKPSHERDWFTSNFYRCLPLAIGNQYGFVITSEGAFDAEWNGAEGTDGVKFTIGQEAAKLYPAIGSHFGSGIITITLPFFLRTPPGINLMTINPPNYIIPNVTVMTGVVEADNLRQHFTLNLKLQIPGIKVHFPAGTALAAILPIPRYFGDKFELKMAEEILPEETIIEELQAYNDFKTKRITVDAEKPYGVGRLYYKGEDIYGNKFDDHQMPKRSE